MAKSSSAAALEEVRSTSDRERRSHARQALHVRTIMDTKEPRPERTITDESLAGERHKTDDELAKRTATFEENADAVVAEARRRADCR